jgi:regulator of protease activity HflC (stomatin/prohibitin superfamily)
MSVASLIVSVVFSCIAFFVGRWSGFFAVYAISWVILLSALIWFVLSLQFYHQQLAEQERLDLSSLGQQEQSRAIFRAGEEASELLATAQRRLKTFEKWIVPTFSIIIAAYQMGMGGYLLKIISSGAAVEQKQPLVCAVYMAAIAFVSFLISRYATGMSAQAQWRPLRAGGSILLCTAILSFALATALALANFRIFAVINAMDWVIPILLVVIGVETALNIILDIYRPRIKGQYNVSAFDSRLLGIISEPVAIFRTAASTIDYQFGFKVSQTWFYKLLEEAIFPLVLFSAATLYLLSCIVVVLPNEQAIIEHFGNPLRSDGSVRIVGPGLTFKWPWPIDAAYKHAVKKISEISIGYVPKVDAKTKEVVREPLLWGKSHYEKEYQLLVAGESTQKRSGAVPISLVIATVPVQYRIKDLYSFLYNHSEPAKLLESICYRELNQFAASAKIEADEENETSSDINKSLLGAGRAEAKKILTERIQRAADKAELGIEIVFLGVQGIHPPPEVAKDYQKVIGAVQKKQALILNADGEKNRNLSTLAGSVENAEELYNIAAKYQRARENNSSEEVEKLSGELDAAFAKAEGDIFKTLREAQSYAFEKTVLAKATGERFDSQLKAYRASEEFYKRQQKLAAFEEAMKNVRKFVVIADKNDTQVFTVDVQEKLTPSLYELSGLEENKPK